MIPLTRLNGNIFVVNPDLLERAESTPDTVVTFVDGSRIVVLESIAELTELIVVFRARVAARAHVLLDETGSPLPGADTHTNVGAPVRARTRGHSDAHAGTDAGTEAHTSTGTDSDSDEPDSAYGARVVAMHRREA